MKKTSHQIREEAKQRRNKVRSHRRHEMVVVVLRRAGRKRGQSAVTHTPRPGLASSPRSALTRGALRDRESDTVREPRRRSGKPRGARLQHPGCTALFTPRDLQHLKLGGGRGFRRECEFSDKDVKKPTCPGWRSLIRRGDTGETRLTLPAGIWPEDTIFLYNIMENVATDMNKPRITKEAHVS